MKEDLQIDPPVYIDFSGYIVALKNIGIDEKRIMTVIESVSNCFGMLLRTAYDDLVHEQVDKEKMN